MSPRLDSWWSGSFSLPGREFHPLEAPGLSWRTEKAPDVGVEHPVHLLPFQPHNQRIQRLVRAAARAEPVREAFEVDLVNLVEDRQSTTPSNPLRRRASRESGS